MSREIVNEVVRDSDDLEYGVAEKMQREVPIDRPPYRVRATIEQTNEPTRGDRITLTDGTVGEMGGGTIPEEIQVEFDHDPGSLPGNCSDPSEDRGKYISYCTVTEIQEFEMEWDDYI